MIVLFVSMFSAFVQTVTGFGYGIIMMAVLPFFVPLEKALVLSTCLSMLLNALIWIRYTKNIQFKKMMVPVVFASMGSLAGLLLFSQKPSPIYKQLLGVFLCVLAVWFIFFSSRVKIKPTLRNGCIAGIVSGVCGGLFSISGPPAIVYFVSVLDDKLEYMATTQFYFFLNNLIILSTRFALGIVPQGLLQSGFYAAVGLVGGTILGNIVFKSTNPQRLKKIVYAVMAISGVYTAFGG